MRRFLFWTTFYTSAIIMCAIGIVEIVLEVTQ